MDSNITKIDQDELIINQTIFSSFSDFCTNSYFDSIINEHKYVNDNFMCSGTSIEQVEEEDMNFNHLTKWCSGKEVVNESFFMENYLLILISNQFSVKCLKIHQQIIVKMIR